MVAEISRKISDHLKKNLCIADSLLVSDVLLRRSFPERHSNRSALSNLLNNLTVMTWFPAMLWAYKIFIMLTGKRGWSCNISG